MYVCATQKGTHLGIALEKITNLLLFLGQVFELWFQVACSPWTWESYHTAGKMLYTANSPRNQADLQPLLYPTPPCLRTGSRWGRKKLAIPVLVFGLWLFYKNGCLNDCYMKVPSNSNLHEALLCDTSISLLAFHHNSQQTKKQEEIQYLQWPDKENVLLNNKLSVPSTLKYFYSLWSAKR